MSLAIIDPIFVRHRDSVKNQITGNKTQTQPPDKRHPCVAICNPDTPKSPRSPLKKQHVELLFRCLQDDDHTTLQALVKTQPDIIKLQIGSEGKSILGLAQDMQAEKSKLFLSKFDYSNEAPISGIFRNNKELTINPLRGRVGYQHSQGNSKQASLYD